LLVEAVDAEVVQDEKVGCQVAPELGFEAVVGAGLIELAQEQVGTPEEDGMASADGGRAEGLSEESLTDADRSDEDDVLSTGKKVEGEELVEVAPVYLSWRIEVEVLKADSFFKASRGELSLQV
jgi:hypothetical protein